MISTRVEGAGLAWLVITSTFVITLCCCLPGGRGSTWLEPTGASMMFTTLDTPSITFILLDGRDLISVLWEGGGLDWTFTTVDIFLSDCFSLGDWVLLGLIAGDAFFTATTGFVSITAAGGSCLTSEINRVDQYLYTK